MPSALDPFALLRPLQVLMDIYQPLHTSIYHGLRLYAKDFQTKFVSDSNRSPKHLSLTRNIVIGLFSNEIKGVLLKASSQVMLRSGCCQLTSPRNW